VALRASCLRARHVRPASSWRAGAGADRRRRSRRGYFGSFQSWVLIAGGKRALKRDR
jgi:hypothetical protein